MRVPQAGRSTPTLRAPRGVDRWLDALGVGRGRIISVTMQRVGEASGTLLGRRRECAVLDGLLAAARDGQGASLVLRGEPGIGKSALLEHARSSARGFRIISVTGVESETELAFGGLHQLCAPLIDRLDQLPAPQRAALETAFGMSAGSPPDRFLVGLAVLSLVGDAAQDAPVVCLVDDAQWLDQISAQTLAFVARRLVAERVVLVFGERAPARRDSFDRLPTLQVTGLADHDARALLHVVAPGPLDHRIREQILAEARGNPLAILELPRERTSSSVADPDGRAGQPLASRIEKGFLRRIEKLAPATRLLLLVAAAEPVGDLALLQRAGEDMGIDVDEAALEAERAGLVTSRGMVRFRHPLVRSAAYRGATTQERRRAHQALADAIDPAQDPDRRLWHLASATPEPAESVATQMEQAASRSMQRGGVAAAAAFLDRASRLTPDPALRGTRALAAAQAKSQAGAYDEALELLDIAGLSPLSDYDEARTDLVRGRLQFFSRSAGKGLPLLLSAAGRLEKFDPDLAKETYRDAMYAALTAGKLAGGSIEQVASSVLSMTTPGTPTRSDLLLVGLSRVIVDGYAAGLPQLQRALADYRTAALSPDEALGWLPLVCRAAHGAWDFDTWSSLSGSLVELARGTGALAVLPSALLLRLSNRVFAGELAVADSLVAEAANLGDVTGSNVLAHYAALVVDPWKGSESQALRTIQTVTDDFLLRGEGKVSTATGWAAAVLYNGLGRYEEAYDAARRGASYPTEMGLSSNAMVELVWAAAHLGRPGDATAEARHIVEMAAASGTDWALGIAALVSAMVGEERDADRRYREAIDRFERSGTRMFVARAHLLFGEWLRRSGRRSEARRMLDVAHRMLSEFGAVAFAERARHELAAVGVQMPKPSGQNVGSDLTQQEARIAQLAADGLTNPEIGTQLFLSAHTVEWHLRKVFSKLGISSRRDIGGRLADRGA
jgi:DNA-binding CsgD family transcriptional regulator